MADQQEATKGTRVSVTVTMKIPTVRYGNVEITLHAARTTEEVLEPWQIAAAESELYAPLRASLEVRAKDLVDLFRQISPEVVEAEGNGEAHEHVQERAPAQVPARTAQQKGESVAPQRQPQTGRLPKRPPYSKMIPGQWWIEEVRTIVPEPYTTKQGKQTTRYALRAPDGSVYTYVYDNSPNYWMLMKNLPEESVTQDGIVILNRPLYTVWVVSEMMYQGRHEVRLQGVYLSQKAAEEAMEVRGDDINLDSVEEVEF